MWQIKFPFELEVLRNMHVPCTYWFGIIMPNVREHGVYMIYDIFIVVHTHGTYSHFNTVNGSAYVFILAKI